MLSTTNRADRSERTENQRAADRRLFPRFLADGEVAVANAMVGWRDGRLVDVSRAGALITTAMPVEVGCALDLDLSASCGPRRRTRWTVRRIAGGPGRWRIGGTFECLWSGDQLAPFVRLDEQLAVEHRILALVRQALETALDAPLDAPSADEWRERVAFLARTLLRHLHRLFAVEEMGDFGGWRDDAPIVLATRLLALRGEHARLARCLDRLSAAAAGSPDRLAGLAERLRRFLRLLGRHCQSETELWLVGQMIELGGEG